MPDSEHLKTATDIVALVGEVMKTAGDNPYVKEAGNNLGQTAVTVTKVIKTLSLILEPINFAGEKACRYFQGKFEQDIGEKFAKIPVENIVEPKASIAGPALHGLAFAHEEQSLKDMYLSLLATAMDGRVATTAHPAFVEIIKQLDGKDAMLASYILRLDVLMPIVQIHLTTAGQKGYTTVATHLIALLDAQTGEPIEELQLPAMIDNLVRLGLVEVNYNRRVTGPAAYDWVKTRPEYIRLREEHENEKVKLTYQKGLITRTQFGQRFAAAVGLLSEHELSITGAAERE